MSEQPANDKEPGVNRLTGKKRHYDGTKVPNPYGRPKGAITKKKSWNVTDRLKYKHKRNPLDELISLADYLRANGKYEAAAEIWMQIQKYNEPAKKAIEAKEEKTPQDSLKAAENALDLMKELEKEFEDADTRTEGKSDTQGVD